MKAAPAVSRVNARAQALLARAEAHDALARADRLEAAALANGENDAEAPPKAPALVDRAGTAAALGVSLATVDRLRLAGCPVIWVCGAPRFEIADVLAWLRSRPAGMAGE